MKRKLTKKAFVAWCKAKGTKTLAGPGHVCPIDHFLGNKEPTVGAWGERYTEDNVIPLPKWAAQFVGWADDQRGWDKITGHEAAKFLGNAKSKMLA